MRASATLAIVILTAFAFAAWTFIDARAKADEQRTRLCLEEQNTREAALSIADGMVVVLNLTRADAIARRPDQAIYIDATYSRLIRPLENARDQLKRLSCPSAVPVGG